MKHPHISEDLLATDSPQGLARKDWAAIKRQVHLGSRRFWARRGVVEPNDGWTGAAMFGRQAVEKEQTNE